MVKAHFDKFQGGFIFCSLLLTENWFYIDSTVGQTYLPTAFYPWLYFQIYVCCMFAGRQNFHCHRMIYGKWRSILDANSLTQNNFLSGQIFTPEHKFQEKLFQIVQTQLFIFSSPEQLNRWSYSTFTFDIQRVMRTWPKFLTIVENFDYFFYNFCILWKFWTILNFLQLWQFLHFWQLWIVDNLDNLTTLDKFDNPGEHLQFFRCSCTILDLEEYEVIILSVSSQKNIDWKLLLKQHSEQ